MLLGGFWAPFETPWDFFGHTLGHLGTPLGYFLVTLGSLWRHFGAHGVLLGVSGAQFRKNCASSYENDDFAYTKPSLSHFHLHPLGHVLGTLCTSFCSPWVHFGTSWDPFGFLFGHLWLTSAQLWHPWVPLEVDFIQISSNPENDGFAYTKPPFSHFHLHSLWPLWNPFGHFLFTLGPL